MKPTEQPRPTDYVVYSPEGEYVLQFGSGDFILYGNKAEAEADCWVTTDEIAIPCTELPQLLLELLINQLNKPTNQNWHETKRTTTTNYR
jgi:hypothetical protein